MEKRSRNTLIIIINSLTIVMLSTVQCTCNECADPLCIVLVRIQVTQFPLSLSTPDNTIVMLGLKVG